MMKSSGRSQSRRSHTKSRAGCRNCKKRHVRCDEHFPECRNCLRHNSRCDYLDFAPGDELPRHAPPVRDLFWSPEVESIINFWETEGEATLGDYAIDLRAHGHQYSRSDLHLMYHILSDQTVESEDFSVWKQALSESLGAARTHPFLIHAILGFATQGLAWEKGTLDAKILSYRHGGIALQGLHKAIQEFSLKNSDACLLATILLSWQSNNWQSYSSLESGCREILKSMYSKQAESSVPTVIELQWLGPSIYAGITAHQTQSDTADSENLYFDVTNELFAAFQSLHTCVNDLPEALRWVEQCKDYFSRLLHIRPAQTSEEQFNYLYNFRKWLFWIPTVLLRSSDRHPMKYMVVAYVFAAAQKLAFIFPKVALSLCSLTTVRPLDKIVATIENLKQSLVAGSALRDSIDSLLQFPRRAAAAFLERFPEGELLRVDDSTAYREQHNIHMQDMLIPPSDHTIIPIVQFPTNQPLLGAGEQIYYSPFLGMTALQSNGSIMSPSLDVFIPMDDPTLYDLECSEDQEFTGTSPSATTSTTPTRDETPV